MYCKKCGTKIDDDSVFCYMCGTNLEEKHSSNITKEKKLVEKENTQPKATEEKEPLLFPILMMFLIILGVFSVVAVILFYIK